MHNNNNNESSSVHVSIYLQYLSFIAHDQPDQQEPNYFYLTGQRKTVTKILVRFIYIQNSRVKTTSLFQVSVCETQLEFAFLLLLLAKKAQSLFHAISKRTIMMWCGALNEETTRTKGTNVLTLLWYGTINANCKHCVRSTADGRIGPAALRGHLHVEAKEKKV